MRQFSKIRFLLFATILLAASCGRQKCDDKVPTIAFVDFEQYTDSSLAKLIIYFQDCDGDIGLEDSDTLDPYNIEGKYYNNMLVDYFELHNGVWEKNPVKIPIEDTTYFYYRLPVITPSGQNKALEGEIEVKLEPYYNPFPPAADTIKYEVTLVDRALNESNKITTPVILVQN
ncbi:hypothetical protein JYU20_04280 [Bacteroidales bacterium AH-315-I05]|nr:hypothetical protein [Bacteroidales bacterium AH-315-I05]